MSGGGGGGGVPHQVKKLLVPDSTWPPWNALSPSWSISMIFGFADACRVAAISGVHPTKLDLLTVGGGGGVGAGVGLWLWL